MQVLPHSVKFYVFTLYIYIFNLNSYYELKLSTYNILPHKVINAGPSMAPNTNLEITIPNAFPPNDFKLFNTLDIKVSTGYLMQFY